MKRKLLAIMMAVCVTASFAGGSATVFAAQEESTAKDEVIVTMPTTSEPESGFDPAYGWGAGEHVHEPLIQSTLTTTNTDLSIGMDLATDYSVSDDGLTWTVKIRDDVKFTDGEPLTASDVAFTYNNCRDNSSVNDFSMLKEAVAVDDTTVEFHMNTPFAVWPYTMAIVGIVPEHAYDENYGQNPIGSGRYIMKQWDKGQQVIFEANPDYYGEAPKMKKVTVLFIEEDAALAAAQSGTVDVAHTAASYSDITVDGYDLFSVQTVDNRGFNLPATAAEEIDGVIYGNDFTSDVEVRRAINIGIDREEMIENVLNGYGTPAYSVCDKMPWYNEEAEVEYDLDKAKEILEAAGWADTAAAQDITAHMVTDGESLCCGLWAERNDLTGKFMQKALTVVDAAEITGKGTVIIGIDSRITHTDKRLFRRSELRLGAVFVDDDFSDLDEIGTFHASTSCAAPDCAWRCNH